MNEPLLVRAKSSSLSRRRMFSRSSPIRKHPDLDGRRGNDRCAPRRAPSRQRHGQHSQRGARAFREAMPVHRLAYSFGWDGNDEMPPGSSLVKIDLIDRGAGTLLRVTHSGLPMRCSAPITTGVGSTIWADWRSPRRAGIPAPIGRATLTAPRFSLSSFGSLA